MLFVASETMYTVIIIFNIIMYLEYVPENEYHQCCSYSTQDTKWEHKSIENGIKTPSRAEWKLGYVISVSE